jgi:hypothetical protein
MNYLTSNVIQTYHDLINKRTKKIANIFGIIAIPSLLIPITLFFIYGFSDQLIFVISLIFASNFVGCGIVYIILRRLFISEKPLYTYLYPKVLEEIQYNEKHDIKYEAYPKIKELIRESLLFTKFASNTTRCGIYYHSDHGNSISIYDTYYYTQSNNSTVVHFNGYYIMINGIQVEPIQIRTKGRPTRTQIHYTRTINEKGLKVFCDKPSAKTNDYIMDIFNKINDKLNPKHLFINTMNQKMYIAIDVHKPKRKIKTLDQQSYDELKNHLIHLTNTISDVLFIEGNKNV